MSLSRWEDPHGLDDDPCPCESDPYRDRAPCPTHLTRCCDGCHERLPESGLADFRKGGSSWSWCPACCVADVEDYAEEDREKLAAIGVWLPQDLSTPSPQTWALSTGLRESLARDLEIYGYLTWSGAEVTLWQAPGHRIATVKDGITWGGAMQRAVVRRAAL